MFKKIRKATDRSSMGKYGGWLSFTLWCAILVSLVLAFILHNQSVAIEGANLFTATSETVDVVNALKELYYHIFNIIGFVFMIGFLVVFAIGFFKGYEHLLTISILGMGFTVAFVALRATIISVAGSIYPGPFAIGEYFMVLFLFAALYNFIATLFKSRFVEDFRKTVFCLGLGNLFIIVFDVWGMVDLVNRAHPMMALSLLFEMICMAAISLISFRTIHSAEQLID